MKRNFFFRGARTPVAAEERYARHGHFPAVLLVEGRPDLAARLERLLFERGFEVLHLSRPEFSADAIADTVRLTQKRESSCSIPARLLLEKTKTPPHCGILRSFI